MAATANMPLQNPSATTAGASRCPAPAAPTAAIAPSEAADPMQPATTQPRSVPIRSQLAPSATVSMPTKTPPFCIPESAVVRPGAQAKTRPANGSRISSCMK